MTTSRIAIATPMVSHEDRPGDDEDRWDIAPRPECPTHGVHHCLEHSLFWSLLCLCKTWVTSHDDPCQASLDTGNGSGQQQTAASHHRSRTTLPGMGLVRRGFGQEISFCHMGRISLQRSSTTTITTFVTRVESHYRGQQQQHRHHQHPHDEF